MMALAQTGCWMESDSWVKGAQPAHQEPSSGLGIQAGDPGGDMLGMPRVVPAWGQLWGLSARVSVVAINNRDVLGGHLQPGCDP